MMSLTAPVDNATQGLHDLMLAALSDNSMQGLHNLTMLLRDHPEIVNTCCTFPFFPEPGGPAHFSTPQPPIFWALSDYHYDSEWTPSRVSILVNHGAELNVLHRNGHSTPLDVLLTGIRSEDDPSHLISIAWFMIHWGADPNHRADVCTTLCDIILGISGFDSAEFIESLLELGFNHNAVGSNGWTALMIAVNLSHHDTVEVLLRHGADPLMPAEPRTEDYPDDRVACNNVTAIELACAIGSLRSVELCFDYDYRIRRRIRLRGEFLSVACSARQVDVIFFLVTKIMISM
jgi:ankyrin repeat protein